MRLRTAVAVVFVLAVTALTLGWIHVTLEDARTFLDTIRS